MTMKDILTRGKKFVYPFFAVTIILIFPSLFEKYQQYQLLCGAAASIGIAHQLYQSIKSKERRSFHLGNCGLLLLVFIMSNEFWNWDSLIRIFPKLSAIPRYWVIGGVLVFLTGFAILCGILSLITRYLPSINHETDACEHLASDETALTHSAISNTQNLSEQNNRSNILRTKKTGFSPKSFPLIIEFTALIGSIGLATYLIIKNETALESLKINTVMVGGKIALWGILMVCFVAFLCGVTVYSVGFIKLAFEDVKNGLKLDNMNKRQMYLRLISLAIVVMLQIIFYKEGFDGWLQFLQKPDEITPIFKGIFMFVMAFFLYNVVYKILLALSDKSDDLWNSVDTFTIRFIKKLITSKGPRLATSAKDFFFDEDTYTSTVNRKITGMLAVVSFVLSAISFAGTAQGIHESVIKGSILGAMGFSFAIQGIVFILNLYMPSILLKINSKRKSLIVLVYFVTVGFSSFFSFVYFSQSMYKGEWVQDAQIQLADEFTASRYELEVFANNLYQTATSHLSADIVEIQKGIHTDNAVADVLDVGAIMNNCGITEVNDLELKKIMDTLSNANTISTASLGKSSTILNARKQYYTDETENLNTEYESCKANIEAINEQIKVTTEDRYKVATRSPAHQQYTALIEKLEEDRNREEAKCNRLEQEIQEKDRLLRLIDEISSYVNSSQMQSGGMISMAITEILTSLTSRSPDTSVIEENLTVISNEVLQSTGTAQYEETLVTIASLESSLSALEAACSVKAWIGASQEYVNEAEKQVDPSMAESEIMSWRNTWNISITELKNQYESIKPYMEDKEQVLIATTLNSFSKLKRDYIINLNKIETSINYLIGKQPTLAMLSLLFALYLDIIPVLLNFCTTGIDTRESKNIKKYSPAVAGANVLIICFLLSRL